MNLPQDKIKLCLIDKRASNQMRKSLEHIGIRCINTTKCNEIYSAISYHPDMSVCFIGDKKVVVAPNVYKYYKETLNEVGYEVIKGNKFLKSNYPNDICYNVAIFGKYAIHNFRYTEETILSEINAKKYTKINVKQGYSKCSICVVDANSIITSDIGIHNEVTKYGINSCLIQNGHIDLFDMNYGFIGGCSGLISRYDIVFTGNISNHPDYNKIKSFIEHRNKKIIQLSKDKLIDLGSIIPIMT